MAREIIVNAIMGGTRKRFSKKLKDDLKIAEDEIRLSRGKDEVAIQRVRDVLLQSGPLASSILRKLRKKHDENGYKQGIQALILLRIAWERYQQHSHKPDDVLLWVNELIRDICQAAGSLAAQNDDGSRSVALKHGAEFAKSILENLHESIFKRHRDVEAVCLYRIGNVYIHCQKNKKSIQYLQDAVEIFKTAFADEARENEYFRYSLWLLGKSYYRLDKFREAKRCFLTAISEIKKSTNFDEDLLRLVDDDLKMTIKKQDIQGSTDPPTDVETPSFSGPGIQQLEIRDTLKTKSLREIGYEKAIELLQRQRLHEGDSLENALMNAECEIRLGRGKEEAATKRIEAVISKLEYGANRVREKGDELERNKLRIQSLLLYQLAWRMYQQESQEPDDKAKWMQNLVHDIFIAAYDLAAEDSRFAKGITDSHGRGTTDGIGEELQNVSTNSGIEEAPTSKSIAVSYGLKLAENMLHKLQDMQVVSQEVLSICQAEIVFRMGNICHRVGDYEQGIEYLKEAAIIYSRHPSARSEYRCESLWILGDCYFRLQKFFDAEKYYNYALSVARESKNRSAQWMRIVEADLQKTLAKRGMTFRFVESTESKWPLLKPPNAEQKSKETAKSTESNRSLLKPPHDEKQSKGIAKGTPSQKKISLPLTLEEPTAIDQAPFRSGDSSTPRTSLKEACGKDKQNRFVASETVTQQIIGGGSVEVGGCFIDFAEGTFDELRAVKVTAEIDPNKWPPGRSVITPSLHVDAGEMKRAASVRLPTWCRGIYQHEDPYFEILRLSEVSGKWSAVGEAQKFRSTEFIEFECMRFSWLVVAFRRRCVYICDCKPIVYISEANICSALVINSKLHKISLLRSLESDWNNANVQRIQFRTFSKKDHDQIDCEIICEEAQRDIAGIVRETEISIRPTNICTHKVEDLLRNGGASTKCLSLVVPRHEGAISVVLTCYIKANGEEFDSGSRNVVISSPSWPGSDADQIEHRYRSNNAHLTFQPHHRHPLVVNTEGGDAHFGPQSNFAGPIQTNNSGHMETQNRSCQSSMDVKGSK